MAKKKKKKIKIRLTGSLIGALPAQRKIVASLGLKKINQVVEHNQSAVIMGMINKVSHLVKIVEE